MLHVFKVIRCCSFLIISGFENIKEHIISMDQSDWLSLIIKVSVTVSVTEIGYENSCKWDQSKQIFNLSCGGVLFQLIQGVS